MRKVKIAKISLSRILINYITMADMEQDDVKKADYYKSGLVLMNKYRDTYPDVVGQFEPRYRELYGLVSEKKKRPAIQT